MPRKSRPPCLTHLGRETSLDHILALVIFESNVDFSSIELSGTNFNGTPTKLRHFYTRKCIRKCFGYAYHEGIHILYLGLQSYPEWSWIYRALLVVWMISGLGWFAGMISTVQHDIEMMLEVKKQRKVSNYKIVWNKKVIMEYPAHNLGIFCWLWRSCYESLQRSHYHKK